MNNRSIIFDHVHLQQKRSEINIMYSLECLRLWLYWIIQPSAEQRESGVRQGRWNWLGYILRDIRRAEGEMKTKTYLEKDCWERAKQSVLEEKGNSQSSCMRQKNVGQTAWSPYAPTGETRHNDDDDDFFSQIHHFCHCTHFFLDIGDDKSVRKRHHKDSFQGQPVINNISKNSTNNSIKQCQKQNNNKNCWTIVDMVQNLIGKHAVAIKGEMLFRVHTCNDDLWEQA